MSALGRLGAALLVALALAAPGARAQDSTTTASDIGVSNTVGDKPAATADSGATAPAQGDQSAPADSTAPPAADAAAAGSSAPASADTAVAPASASDQQAPDYAAWQRVAQRGEQAVQAGRASDQALQSLRAEVVQWRDLFAKAKAENTVRINTLKTQIATLGPKPKRNQTEPAVLTEQRNALTAQLDQLETPVKNAELAFARADALVGAIDTLLRSRQTDELFSLSPTPLNPVIWPGALDDLRQTVTLAWRGVASSWGSDVQRSELRANLPLTLLLTMVALVLLLRGRRWVLRAGEFIGGTAGGPAKGVWGFLVSLGQIAAPLAGIYALVEALHTAGVLGLRAQVFVDALPAFGLSLFLARWLGNRVFGQADVPWTVLNLPPTTRTEGRFDAGALGLLYGLSLIVHKVADYESYSVTTKAVLFFPIFVIAAIFLFRMGRLLRIHAAAETEAADAGPGFLTRTARLAGLLIMLVGIAGPLAAAVGYMSLADNFIFPAVLTVALAAALFVLHHFFVDLYGLIFGTDEQTAGEALLPVMASFVMLLASLPVIALIWGARVTDLTELWAKVKGGVTIGGTVLSPADLMTFAVVFTIGYALTRLLQGMLETTILPKTKIDLGGRNAIKSGVGYLGLFLAALVAITAAGIDLSSLAIVAGALSVGIGFGLQNIVSNFVSGIILLIERPISEGDWIEVGGQMGTVRDISVRSTRIETFDRTDVILPNSDLISGVVTNYTRGNLIGRVIVPVGVAYGSDTRKVEEILKEVAEAHPIVTVNPPPVVYFRGFGADSLDFEIRAILKDVNFILSVASDMNHEIARRFAEEGIEIPFAQRDIWLRNPEAIAGKGPGAPPPPKKKKRPTPPPKTPDAETARTTLEPEDMPESSGYGQEDADE